jgi:serpin B
MLAGIMLAACHSDTPIDGLTPIEPRAITPEEQQVITASNSFAFDIFSRLSEREDNMFISPFSISTALAMTANGAAGDTREAIKTAIHLQDLSDEEMNSAYRDLVKYLLELDDKIQLELANSSWYRQNLTVKESFRAVLLDYYDAEIRSADFSDPATRDIINGWIEEKTHDKIREMIDQIPQDVVMYLINAIYFKADWRYQFDEAETAPRNFFLENGSAVDVEMMYSKGVKIHYYQSAGSTYIEIPYGGGLYNMTIMLPPQGTPLQNMIEGIDMEIFRSHVQQADTATVAMHMPKFKMEYKAILNDVLSAMGMGIAFGGGADLSDLFVQTLDLYISRVIHQSFIEVNEKGSEAAAATVVEIRETSIQPGRPPEVVHINRPFAFFITEKHSGTILFAGKVTDPAAL